MKNSTYNESRVVALSLTLPEIDPQRFSDLWGKMSDEGFDMVSWNASYRIYEQYYNQAYINVLDAVMGYQVVRHFICECRIRYGRIGEDFRYTEVCQHWLCPDGTIVVMAKRRRTLKSWWDGNVWWFGSKMSIKHGDYGYIFSHISQDYYSDMQLTFVDGIDPKGFHKLGQFILPLTEETNGGMCELHQLRFTFGEIGEWLIKSGHLNLFNKIVGKEYYMNEVKKRKQQIKIAYRNGYDIAELTRLSLWFDYLDWLEAEGKDIHNPYYICSNEKMEAFDYRRNAEARARQIAYQEAQAAREAEMQRRLEQFRAEHPDMDVDDKTRVQTEYLIRREIEMHEQNRQRLSHIPEWEEEYEKAKRAYIGIGFTSADGTINFHVLKSVEEFYEEAEAMVHCLFNNSCNYFERKDSLILSARDAETDERLATIELNIKTMQISQIKAKYDSVPKRYNDIQASIYNNINIFKQAKKKKAV